MGYKFAHIGSYNRNLGDNVALYNVRNEFNNHLHGIEWVSIDIMDVFWRRNNNIKFVKEFLNKSGFDAIVVGGGGLIEYEGYQQHDTGYKLPFNKEILESITCPTFFMGLGINYFRGKEGFSDKAKSTLKDVVELSSYFSLRNDGSHSILKNLINVDTNEIPDPGLIFEYEKIITKGGDYNIMQPAFNSSESINQNRFLGKSNIDSLTRWSSDMNLITMPHTPKDFKYFSNYIIDSSHLREMLAFGYTDELTKVYLNFDSVIAMRGHGQLISIGLNVPGLYFSTQDKVRDFSLQNGFSEYNIDIRDSNWMELLQDKFSNIKVDSEYRRKWYDLRNTKIKDWRTQFKNAVLECINKLK